MNKFLIVGLGNIGAEYKYTPYGFKILDYFAKRTTFISNRQTVPLQNTNLKEEPFKTEYLHELIWESGTLDGQRKYFT
jgi:peptidyl-tRNA hydrolase